MTGKSAEFFFDGSNDSAGSGGSKEKSKREIADDFRRQHQGTSRHQKWQERDGKHNFRKPMKKVTRY